MILERRIIIKQNPQHSIVPAKPILKWAGGKTQILGDLMRKAPDRFNRYIEPFIGGGAMFFALRPRSGVIADSNPELVNLYRCIAGNVGLVIKRLQNFKNTESEFYEVRDLCFGDLEKEYAAARTIYLNRTCFNGLFALTKAGDSMFLLVVTKTRASASRKYYLRPPMPCKALI